jgi:hypothetical protein
MATKNPNLGEFWRDLQWEMLGYFMAFWSALQSFGIFLGYLVYFPRFGLSYLEKSGFPGPTLLTK